MRYAVELSGEHPTLPEAEVRAVLDADEVVRDGRLALVDADPDRPYQRLALAHHVGRHLGSAADLDGLVDQARDWDDVGSPFAVRASVRSGDRDRQEILDRVGAALGDGRDVDLEAPASVVRVVAGEQLHAHLVLASIDRAAMRQRVPHKRPGFEPTSLAPRLARAMVNLARPRDGLWDPFCGTGGIVLEAALLGDRAVGGDVEAEAVAKAERNLAAGGVSADLYVGDVRDPPVRGGVDAVATDPPYGRSTATAGSTPGELVDALLVAAGDALGGGRVVAGLHEERSSVPVGSVEAVYPLRVHRSLTRYITIVRV